MSEPVGCVQARGLRAAHQKSDGFAASAGRTFAAPLAAVHAEWPDARRRARWLAGAEPAVRKRRRVTPALERRRHTLETMRELIRRLAAAESAGDNNTAAKALIEETAARLASRPVAEAVSGLRQSESALSGSKPGL